MGVIKKCSLGFMDLEQVLFFYGLNIWSILIKRKIIFPTWIQCNPSGPWISQLCPISFPLLPTATASFKYKPLSCSGKKQFLPVFSCNMPAGRCSCQWRILVDVTIPQAEGRGWELGTVSFPGVQTLPFPYTQESILEWLRMTFLLT